VSQAFLPLLGRLSLLAGALLAGAACLHADTPPTAAPGYKMVPIAGAKGKTSYIQVQDSGPYSHVKDNHYSPDDHNPEDFSFNTTSNDAHKAYDMGGGAAAESSSYQKSEEKTFVTKSYFANDSEGEDKTTPGLHDTVPVSSAEGFSRTAPGYDKSYLTASAADADQNKTADFATTTASEEGRSADLGGHEVKKFASPMSSKKYEGPEVGKVKRDMDDMNAGLTGMKDLPNRALTIDEVRALINHGVKPDLDEKPTETSKPLNDPNYTPDAAPAPLREKPGDEDHLKTDEDGLPSPGAIAQPAAPAPESAEPLPQ
jgi:hypothetical protein